MSRHNKNQQHKPNPTPAQVGQALDSLASKLPQDTLSKQAPLEVPMREQKEPADELPELVNALVLRGAVIRNGVTYKEASFDKYGRLKKGTPVELPRDEFVKLFRRGTVTLYRELWVT